MGVTIFGHLEKIDKFAELSYKNKGAIIRFLKAAASVTVAALLVAAAQGVLFPAEFSGLSIILITGALQAVDKWLRERNVEEETKEQVVEEPLTENAESVGVNPVEETFDSEVVSETAEVEGGEADTA